MVDGVLADRHAHFVAHRADDVVGGEQREEHGERGQKRRHLVGFDADEPLKQIRRAMDSG